MLFCSEKFYGGGGGGDKQLGPGLLLEIWDRPWTWTQAWQNSILFQFCSFHLQAVFDSLFLITSNSVFAVQAAMLPQQVKDDTYTK